MVVTSCFRYMGYNNFSHFMIDVLNLKLRFITLTLNSCSDGEVRFVIRAWLHFFHSNLNLLMVQWSSFILVVRKGLFCVSAINRFDFSI